MREARAGNGYRWTRTHRKVFSAGRRSGVRHWITWYNSGRPHQALGYLSPADYRAQKLQHVACFRGSTTLTSVILLYKGTLHDLRLIAQAEELQASHDPKFNTQA
ncbi:integrase core domain-containing protein [Desulfocurvibacter africanus]|uniref:integrase core domain-containing protein n=1 Tax=Desulfocurvibacter africanus TaxID=873 RepID=UPI003A4D98D4